MFAKTDLCFRKYNWRLCLRNINWKTLETNEKDPVYWTANYSDGYLAKITYSGKTTNFTS